MILVEVHDEGFQRWLSTLEVRLTTMIQTLMNVAQIIELNTQKLVPYDYDKPWGGQHLETSFKAVPTGNPVKGFIEVEIGYSSIDPRDGYDYAEYVHQGYDWRTGKPLHFQKATAQARYLWTGVTLSRKEGFKEIETDYFSLFGGRL